MLTESEAYTIVFMTTLNIFKHDLYEKTAHKLFDVISTHINNDIIERYDALI